jgi:trk system potassium uptake protein TrkA
MKKTFGVIGLGRFGFYVAKTLAELGAEVIAIDSSEDRVREIADFVTQTYILDAMDERALKESGINNCDIVIVSIGQNVEANLIVVMILIELGVKEIIAKAVTPLHGKLLEKMGVARVVYPERDMAVRVAHSLLVKNVLEEIPLTAKYGIYEVSVPSEFVGKSLKELHLRRRFNLNVLAIRRDGDLLVNPTSEDIIKKGDILLLLGETEGIVKLPQD